MDALPAKIHQQGDGRTPYARHAVYLAGQQRGHDPAAKPRKPRSTRRTVGFTNTDLPQWELAYLPLGIAMREYNDFSPARVAIWGVTHVISVEVFIAIDLLPGQAMQWSRRYEFLEIADE